MAKKVKTVLKLNLPAGKATPAPPVGPALGQHGVAIMDFVKAFNDRTANQKNTIVPAVITIYEDHTFEFALKKPPVVELIKQKLRIEKGAGKAGVESAGKLTDTQIAEIAKEKMEDLNTTDIEAAKKIVMGTAKSMGIEVK